MLEKVTAATKAFFVSAIDYAPSGALYTAMALGLLVATASAFALGGMTLPLFGHLAYNTVTPAILATHAAVSMGLGAVVTGMIGAVNTLSTPTETNDLDVEGRSQIRQERGLHLQRQRESDAITMASNRSSAVKPTPLPAISTTSPQLGL